MDEYKTKEDAFEALNFINKICSDIRSCDKLSEDSKDELCGRIAHEKCYLINEFDLFDLLDD